MFFSKLKTAKSFFSSAYHRFWYGVLGMAMTREGGMNCKLANSFNFVGAAVVQH